jgi:hypothetical protein
VLRGGSWATSNRFEMQSSYRNVVDRNERDVIYGFRCVLVTEPRGDAKDHQPVTDFELRRSSLRMAGVVPVNALWKQAFATALAPARKSGAAAFCSHTRAKTVLTFTRSFRWLISAFHRP